ncbi:hypothetical protein FZI91_04785 [Mycobacterium sp. CBMA271]|uniref:hypothetical protein n=1 Tax=unclassified Mycobacteroides TaxID=2618759 RepID=UPI0012DF489D|nr:MULTISPECIES: hypothetical protein [unclassified Mycobacteroides]MUM19827.1 hypothetical protein [Mycobacteroides sp. CBMA 326]MUM21016.1 hypothetical protein [Mycobacteroides sp. CBMA 271]
MKRRPLLRRAIVWITATVLMAIAIFLRNHQVDDQNAHAPIDIHGSVEQPLVGRNVTASVDRVRLTPLIHADWGDDKPDDFRAHNDATFVVFEVTVASVVANGFGFSDFHIGDKTFGSQYVGFPPSIEQLTPGFPSKGRITFEIPGSLTQSVGYLRVVGDKDPRLDSRLVFAVDLTKVERLPSITLKRGIAG